ncbi:MAG: hypothetical protein N3H31_07210 [Candidatus Nezhaarchaeota archaeon]|nr:hypothetical protein [Candidatus Nezhaarchaeota archaeon]
MWEYVLGGAIVFGLMVGSFSIYNGRVTRKVLTKVLIEEGERMRTMVAKMDEGLDEVIKKMDGRFAKMGERLEALLRNIEVLIERSSKEHAAILEALRTR